MSSFSLLSLLNQSPAPFYREKMTPQEKGLKGGGTLRLRKEARQQAQRARVRELLLKRLFLCQIAKELGVSPTTIKGDIDDDPELKKLASLYVKNGGWRGGPKKRNKKPVTSKE